ncbi:MULTISPECIES: hypothetical protein [unclassified Luteimonas]
MPLTESEIEELKARTKQFAENYPDIENLIASGKVKYKSGWYQISDSVTFDLVKDYVTGLRSSNDGKLHVKLSKPSKRLKSLAAKL